MPRIPTAADLPGVQLQRGPTVSIDPNAYGVGMSEGVEQAAGKIIAIVDKKRVEADEAEAQDLINRLSQKSREIWQGDGSEQNPGYGNLKGRMAVDSYAEAERRLAAERDALLAQSSNARVQRLVQPRFNALSEQNLTRFGDHRSNQQTTWEKSVLATTIAEGTQFAIDNTGADAASNALVAEGVGVAGGAAYRAAMKETGDADVAASAREKAVSEAHKAVVASLLARDMAPAAEAYLAQHRDDIDGDVRVEIEKAVQDGVVRGESQRIADEFETRFNLGTAGGASAALNAIKGIENPTVRDEVEKRILSRTNQLKALKGMQDDALQEQAWATADAVRRGEQTIDALTPAMRRAVGTSVTSLMNYASGQEEPTTDWEVFHKLMEMPAKDLAAPDFDLWQHRDQLADSQWTAVTNLRRSYRDALANGEEPKVQTYTQQVATAVDRLGLTGGKKAEDRGAFERLAYTELDNETKRLGRDLTFAERQAVIDSLTVEVVSEKSWWFNSNKTLEALQRTVTDPSQTLGDVGENLLIGDKVALDPTIPVLAIDDIARALRRTGLPVNGTNINSLWKRSQGGN